MEVRVQFVEIFQVKFELPACKHSGVLLEQLCPTRGHRAACDSDKGFVQPTLGFRCSKSILHTDNLSIF